MGRIVGIVTAVDVFRADSVVVPTILPVVLGCVVALAALALVGWCNLGGVLRCSACYARAGSVVDLDEVIF